MSGQLITVVPPTLYDLTSLNNVNLATMSFIVASRIDTTGVESGVLQVRVHAINIQTAGDRIDIDASLHGYSPDDPGTDFGQVGASMANVNFIGIQQTPPLYSTISLSGNFGGQLKIVVKGTRGSAVSTTLSAKLSIDLVLKTGAAARDPMARMPGTFLGYR